MNPIRPCLPLLAASLLALWGCDSPAPADTDVAEAKPAEAAAERRVPVKTLVLEPQSFDETLEVTGIIKPWQEVVVSAELGGLVREVDFDKGDHVTKGQVLARIGDDLIAAQLDQAKADLMAAEANYQKISKLFERQAVPQQDLVAATSRRDRSRAVVREMTLRLERAVLRAPLDGETVDRRIEPGEVIAPGTPVTLVQRIDRLKIECSVPDTEIRWLRIGQKAQVRVDALPGEVLEARVRFVAPAADEGSRSFPVELSLDNRRGLLRPGLVSRIELLKRHLDRAVVIPVDAMVPGEETRAVFVIDECKARRVPVHPAATEGSRALIEGDLRLGERLVVEGQRDLGPGTPVLSEDCP